jgi:hypothetical protein
VSFTADEKVSICKITGVRSDVLDNTLTIFANAISDEAEDAVRGEIERWDQVSDDFVSIEPTEANFGAKINPNLAKADIRKNIVTLLYLPIETGSRIVRA